MSAANVVLRIGDLFISRVGTWVIVGERNGDPLYKSAMGMLFNYERWPYVTCGVRRNDLLKGEMVIR